MSQIIPCKKFTSKLFQSRAVPAILLDETACWGQGDFVAFLNYKTLPISSRIYKVVLWLGFTGTNTIFIKQLQLFNYDSWCPEEDVELCIFLINYKYLFRF